MVIFFPSSSPLPSSQYRTNDKTQDLKDQCTLFKPIPSLQFNLNNYICLLKYLLKADYIYRACSDMPHLRLDDKSHFLTCTHMEKCNLVSPK